MCVHVSDQRLKNRLYEGGVRSWGLFVRPMLINQHLPDKTRTGRYANGTNDIGIPAKDGKCYNACKIIFEHKNVAIKKSINKTTMLHLNLNSVFSL